MTIRVFIASSPDGIDAEANMACEYSIRSRSSEPVEIYWMQLTRDPESPWYSNPEKHEGWDTSNWVTPFSGFRWAIPAVCGYHGRAIYCDNDVLCLDDIAKLNNMTIAPGKVAVAKSERRFCVTLFDCAAARPYSGSLDKLRRGGRNLIKGNPKLVQEFTADQNWNCLDGENMPVAKIKMLHFTSIDSQPNVPLAVARLAAQGKKHWFDSKPKPHWRPELTALWHQDYNAALAAGYKIETYIPVEVFGPVPKRSLQNYKGLRAR